MRLFIGMVGRNMHGIDSCSRGEGRWALNLIRCLSNEGHEIFCAPDTEECSWGSCPIPKNVTMVQPHEKRLLYNIHFDAAIFTSWSDAKPERTYIIADKYIWGVMGWKSGLMVDEFFADNEYIIRFGRDDMEQIPYPINFRDRCFLLTQPFGKKFGESKFDNRRVAWLSKEAFMPEVHLSLAESAKKHLYATVDACKETGCGLSVFNAHELNPSTSPRVREMGIIEKLKELPDVRMYSSMPYSEYQRELCKCSVTVPFTFHASSQEVVFNGIVPMIYKDSGFACHSWTGSACSDLTDGKLSRAQSEVDIPSTYTQEEIKNKIIRLLTDKVFYNTHLCRLRPMVIDNLDEHVVYQFGEIMKHNSKGK